MFSFGGSSLAGSEPCFSEILLADGAARIGSLEVTVEAMSSICDSSQAVPSYQYEISKMKQFIDSKSYLQLRKELLLV